jgi:hypothetical protein
MFSSMSAPTVAASSPSSSASSDVRSAALSAVLASEAGGAALVLPSNPAAAVSGDSGVAAAFNKALAPDYLAVFVFLAATGGPGQQLRGLSVRADAPAGFTVVGVRADVASRQAGPSQLSVDGAVSSLQLALRVSLSSATSSPAAAQLAVRVSFHGGASTVSVPLDAADILRPLRITTQDYGGRWKASAMERKLRVAAPGATGPDSMLARLSQRLGIHAIQSIAKTGDGIAAGVVMGQQRALLVYGKLAAPGAVDVTVRSSERALTDSVADALQSAGSI